MKFKNFERAVNVRYFLIDIIFQRKPNNDILKKAKGGLDLLEKAVNFVFNQNLSMRSLNLDTVAAGIGVKRIQFTSQIVDLQVLASRTYDGAFDAPKIMSVERLFYILITIFVAEYGRVSEKVSEYSVMTNIDAVLDINSICDLEDIRAWVVLVDYFIYCLDEGDIKISQFIKRQAPGMSCRKIKDFLVKQCWYQDQPVASNISSAIFSSFGLPEVLQAGVKIFREKKMEVEQRNA
mgnify:CR=1 FL=1